MSTAALPAGKQPIYKSLYLQVIVAMILGILLGHYYPAEGVKLGEPLNKGFIGLITMMIAPIIFCTVIVGIAGMESMKTVGKTGGLALLYFEVVSTLALVIGLVVVNVMQPGVGRTVAMEAVKAPPPLPSFAEYMLGIIPKTLLSSLTEGNILQALLVAVLCGFALHRFGGRGTMVFDFVEKVSHVLFVVIGYIMKLAPIGAFGGMAYTIGKFGIASLFKLGFLMGTFYVTCLLFVFVVLGLIARFHGFNIFKFVKYIKEELLIVLGTSSSESALPRMMEKMENLGASKAVVSLVIPTGYSFNLDGTSIYLTMGAVFLAQATNTPMSLTQQVLLLGFLLLASKGAAGVTGSGLAVLSGSLQAIGHVPMEALGMITGIDRFMSEARALTNLVGNGVATLVVAKWTDELDMDRLQAGLNGETWVEAQEPEVLINAKDSHMAT